MSIKSVILFGTGLL